MRAQHLSRRLLCTIKTIKTPPVPLCTIKEINEKDCLQGRNSVRIELTTP